MSHGQDRVTVIEPGRLALNYWYDLWRYRELLLVLAWRDIAVRYKQTAVGIAWALLRPFLTMVVFTIVFGRLAGLPSVGGAPYAVMVFAGMLPWFLFSGILSEASGSLVANASLIGKVYFPRLLIPIAAAAVTLADFAVNFAMLLVLMAWYGLAPTWRMLAIPAVVLYAVLASLGPALALTALNVRFRDVRYVIPFVVQFGLYVSPVGFSTSVVPQAWRPLYNLNPVVGIVDAFRWCIIAGEPPSSPAALLAGALVAALLLWQGIGLFRRTERTFADLI